MSKRLVSSFIIVLFLSGCLTTKSTYITEERDEDIGVTTTWTEVHEEPSSESNAIVYTSILAATVALMAALGSSE